MPPDGVINRVKGGTMQTIVILLPLSKFYKILFISFIKAFQIESLSFGWQYILLQPGLVGG